MGFTFRHTALIYDLDGYDLFHTATNNVKLTTTP